MKKPFVAPVLRPESRLAVLTLGIQCSPQVCDSNIQ